MARILMVDDNVAFLKPMGQILAAKGHEATTVGTGVEAQELLRSEGCDVLITDVSMEPVSGMELLDMVQKECPEVPVIMLTGFATFELALRAVKAGAFDLLTKPFRVDQLLETIDRVSAWQTAIVEGQTSPPPDSYKARALKEFLRSQVPSIPGHTPATRKTP
jgi:DNA-binding NtrC family response regulator